MQSGAMTKKRRPTSSDDPALTAAEQIRLDALLGSVSTHTLLHSLTGLDRESEDARLIIAALMNRLPSHADMDEAWTGGDQTPVMPM